MSILFFDSFEEHFIISKTLAFSSINDNIYWIAKTPAITLIVPIHRNIILYMHHHGNYMYVGTFLYLLN